MNWKKEKIDLSELMLWKYKIKYTEMLEWWLKIGVNEILETSESENAI